MVNKGDFQSSAKVRVRNKNKVQTYISLSNIEQSSINELKAMNIEIVNTPSFAHSKSGGVRTEGDAILKANFLRYLGFSGQGIKVGVVSDGSNDWTSARDSAEFQTRYANLGVVQLNKSLLKAAYQLDRAMKAPRWPKLFTI